MWSGLVSATSVWLNSGTPLRRERRHPAAGSSTDQLTAHVSQERQDQMIPGPLVVAQRHIRGRFEEHGEGPVAGQVRVELGGEQRTLGKRVSSRPSTVTAAGPAAIVDVRR